MPGPLVGQILILVVALQHCAFCALEMFYWDKPLGRKIFRTDPELASRTRVLASNQGLYNLFLAGGLFSSFLIDPAGGHYFRFYFLACVVIAGIYGGLTINPRIAIVQAGPAAFALFFYILGI